MSKLYPNNPLRETITMDRPDNSNERPWNDLVVKLKSLTELIGSTSLEYEKKRDAIFLGKVIHNVDFKNASVKLDAEKKAILLLKRQKTRLKHRMCVLIAEMKIEIEREEMDLM
jgi:hypothetical protein